MNRRNTFMYGTNPIIVITNDKRSESSFPLRSYKYISAFLVFLLILFHIFQFFLGRESPCFLFTLYLMHLILLSGLVCWCVLLFGIVDSYIFFLVYHSHFFFIFRYLCLFNHILNAIGCKLANLHHRSLTCLFLSFIVSHFLYAYPFYYNHCFTSFLITS